MSILIDQAIQKKDFFELKCTVAWEMEKDPLFQEGGCEECVQKIKESGLWAELQEEYDESANWGGYKSNPKEWTEEYYFLTLQWLKDNFAYDKRIEHIKEVGKVAFKDLLKAEPVKKRRTILQNQQRRKNNRRGFRG